MNMLHYSDEELGLHNHDSDYIVMSCICTDPEPETMFWIDMLPPVKGFENGWNMVKNFKIPGKVVLPFTTTHTPL